MGFFNSVLKGAKKGVTGGDGKMDLEDFLKMGGMAASAATGNVPGMIAIGTSMAGDATGSKELGMLGDVGSIAAGGIGAAGALSGGVGAVDAATGAADVVSGLGEGTGAALQAADGLGAGMGALDGAQGFNAVTGIADGAGSALGAVDAAAGAGSLAAGIPDALQAGVPPGAFDAVTGTGDIMAGVPESLQAGLAGEDGGGALMNTLKGFLGDTAGERMETGVDMVGDAATEYQEQAQGPEAIPQEWQQTEDIMNYIPTHMTALRDYLSQSGIGGNQFTSQFNQYGG